MIAIHPIEGDTSKPGQLKRKILQALKSQRVYRSDFMYRGFSTTQQGIPNLQKYGTDRNPEGLQDELLARVARREATLLEKTPTKWDAFFGDQEDPTEFLQDSFEPNDLSPNLIWALPEEGLTTCIETYAAPEDPANEIAMIGVYRPENLLWAPEETACFPPQYPIPDDERPEDMLDEQTAIYKFRPGTTALETAVTFFRIIPKIARRRVRKEIVF